MWVYSIISFLAVWVGLELPDMRYHKAFLRFFPERNLMGVGLGYLAKESIHFINKPLISSKCFLSRKVCGAPFMI